MPFDARPPDVPGAARLSICVTTQPRGSLPMASASPGIAPSPNRLSAMDVATSRMCRRSSRSSAYTDALRLPSLFPLCVQGDLGECGWRALERRPLAGPAGVTIAEAV
jgi:hypothetical protein